MAAQGALLKDAMTGWKSGLSDGWGDLFDGVEPDLDALGVLKAADCHPLPRGAGGVAQRHLTRAFDGLAPDKVRVVVIGEDPYPEKKKRNEATGRAFEDGAWKWDPQTKLEGVAKSLMPLLLSAAACEIDGFEPTGAAGEVETLAAHIADGRLRPPAAPGYFDALAARGVLFVNATWTYTSGADKEKHRRAWKPLMARLVQKLTCPKRQNPVIFLLLGVKARERFMSAFCDLEIDGLKAFNMCMATVYHPHPSPQSVKKYWDEHIARGNPLARVNKALRDLGAGPIQWWPELESDPNATGSEGTTPPDRAL